MKILENIDDIKLIRVNAFLSYFFTSEINIFYSIIINFIYKNMHIY